MKISVLLLIFVIGACEIYIPPSPYFFLSEQRERERERDTKYLKAEICLVIM
jgi:hypothetical protein